MFFESKKVQNWHFFYRRQLPEHSVPHSPRGLQQAPLEPTCSPRPSQSRSLPSELGRAVARDLSSASTPPPCSHLEKFTIKHSPQFPLVYLQCWTSVSNAGVVPRSSQVRWSTCSQAEPLVGPSWSPGGSASCSPPSDVSVCPLSSEPHSSRASPE